MTEKTGCVWLIGAGCGGADLLTVRGRELLGQCDVVVYDDLIGQDLLAQVPPGARRLYMGKRCGKHSAPQEEICRVLVEEARAGRRVARLKGGDPFVFGRGGEEAQALKAAGIPFQVVPGISSAIAIPAAAGIPVTHRGVSRSLHILTGHTAGDGLPENFAHLAALEGTLVFLMGLSRLEEIAAGLLAAGMAPGTPAAVLSGGNSPHPAAVRATLDTIAPRTREADVRPPAVIVVGGTAALDLRSGAEGPLAGVRVDLTGTDGMAARLRAALEPLGAETRRAERAVVEELPTQTKLADLCREGRWLVFTSANGVEVFFRRLRREGADLRCLAGCLLAVIGGATGAALERHGFRPDLCPGVSTSEGLAAALAERMSPGGEAVLLRAAEASRQLPTLLRQRGIAVLEAPLYTVRSAGETDGERPDPPDYLVFASAGGVERYFAAHGAVPAETVCVCIGPVTARALAERYEKSFLTAADISAAGIAETIREHQTTEKKGRNSHEQI